ncbi:HNH endonuclease [Yimella lutea]|uniref:HNH endonuclease n=1 Tax=Yimella lutea TaxID=587872 RepID=A0A542EBG7_9MICO|nr:HNH endonuclease [Yimella lutea]
MRNESLGAETTPNPRRKRDHTVVVSARWLTIRMRANEAVGATETVEPEPFSSKAVLDNPAEYDPAYVARYDLERAAGALTGAYADLITVMRESLTEQHWAVSGIRSPEHWLTCFAGVSRAAATDIVRIASRANELPHAIAAFERTEITFHQLAVIARHVPAGFDEDVTRLAPHCDVGQLRRAVAKYPFPADDTDDNLDDDVDEDEVPEPDPSTRPAQLRSWFDKGRYHLEFDGPVDQGELLEQVLNEAKNALFQQTRHTDSDGDNNCDQDCGQDPAIESDQDTTAQRIPAAFGGTHLGADSGEGLDAAGKPRITLADAFLEAMLHSLHAGTQGVSGRADTYRVLFHLDAHGHGWSGGAGALPPALREKLSCDGLIVPIIEKNGFPVDVGRTQRIVPRRTLRLVHDRDHGCRFPGCGTHRYVEVHHVIHWAKGGNTDLGNLISLCPFHHDRLHAGDFTITTMAPGFFTFHDRYGDRFGYRPPDPATPPGTYSKPAEPAKPYERQSWEPLNLHWIEFHNTG